MGGPAAIWAHPSPPFPQVPIRGVNLGNWLVLERWMESAAQPGPFAGTTADDEYGLRRDMDDDELDRRLRAHRAAYVTRDDILWLADRGCNLLRIPVPYHVLGDATHESCLSHLDDAMDWAAEAGIAALVDLHTVPGGQNGFDNSGTSGLCSWHQEYPQVTRTLSVLESLAERYESHPALFGIEAMNEPASKSIYAQSMKRYGADHPTRVERSTPIPHDVLAQFYRLVNERLRPILGPKAALVFHDQFQLEAWDRFLPASRYPNVWIDTHQYVGTAARAVHAHGLRAHLALAKAVGLRITRARHHHPILVGEWSLTQHIRRIERLDSDVRVALYRRYASAQMAAFERGMGSCFWSLRNGRYDDWSFEACVRHGWIDFRS